MKFAKIVGFVFLVINAANSVPVEEEQEEAKEEVVDIEEMLFSNADYYNVMEDNTSNYSVVNNNNYACYYYYSVAVDIDGEGTNPSAHFKEEVKEYFQQEKFRKLHTRVARQNNESKKL